MRSPRQLVRDTITGRFTKASRAQSDPTHTVTETPTPRLSRNDRDALRFWLTSGSTSPEEREAKRVVMRVLDP